MIRFQAVMAMAAAVIIVTNMIYFGPMYSLISLAASSGSIQQETAEEANQLCKEIAEEGLLPMTTNTAKWEQD